jgi:POT family proton-dependent oligopeptide transporter
MILISRYFIEEYQYSGEMAAVMYSIFTYTVTFFPLFGSYLSDSILGKFRTITGGSIIYALASAVLALSGETKTEIVAIVSMICCGIGAGGINASVTSFGADQFDSCASKERSAYFSYLYACQNVAATIMILCNPEIAKRFGYFYAFLIPGISMVISAIVLVSGRFLTSGYFENPLGKAMFSKIFKPMWYMSVTNQSDQEKEEKAILMYGQESVRWANVMYKLLPVFSFTILFWTCNELQYSRLFDQAVDMNLYNIFTVQQSGVPSGIFIVIFAILFDKMYPILEKRGFNVSFERRLTIGFIFEMIAVLVMIVLQYFVDASEKGSISFFWQILYCLPVAIAEVLVAVSSVEFAYQTAPAEMKSILIAICSVFRSFGNIVLIVINLIFEHTIKGQIFFQLWVYVILMILNILGFYYFIDSKASNIIQNSTVNDIPDDEEESGNASIDDIIADKAN